MWNADFQPDEILSEQDPRPVTILVSWKACEVTSLQRWKLGKFNPEEPVEEDLISGNFDQEF